MVFLSRHANGVQLNNVEVSFLGAETRPAFMVDNVKGIAFFRVKAQAAVGVKNVVLQNTEDFSWEGMDKVKKLKKVEAASF